MGLCFENARTTITDLNWPCAIAGRRQSYDIAKSGG